MKEKVGVTMSGVENVCCQRKIYVYVGERRWVIDYQFL
jgi:hypothetical protein